MTPIPEIVKEWAALRPFGGFQAIVADPPWRYRLYSAAGEAKAPQAHYECQPIEWIKALPVGMLAGEHCVLWLWAINPMLPDALDALRAWGFEFKTAGHWSKKTKHGKQSFGTGYILRGAGEPFLIGTRGSPIHVSRSIRSVIEAPVREHSRKPDEAFEAAELLWPAARRIELFSRQPREGWTVWGDQTQRFEAAQ